LEQYYGEQAEEHAAELVEHFAEAETVLGTEKLAQYCLAAGESALSAMAWDDALQYFENAYEAIQREPQTNTDELLAAHVQYGLGRARAPRGPVPERQVAWNQLSSAYEVFVRHGETDKAVSIATNPMTLGGLVGATEILRGALSLVPEDSLEAGWIWTRYGTSLMDNESDADGAEAAYRKGNEIGQLHGSTALQARANAHLCQVTSYRDETEEAIRHGELVRKYGVSSGEWGSICRGSTGHIQSHLHNGNLDEAYKVGLEALDASMRTGATGWRGGAGWALSLMDFLRGDWAAIDRNSEHRLPTPLRGPETNVFFESLVHATTGGTHDFDEQNIDRLKAHVEGMRPLASSAICEAARIAEAVGQDDLRRFVANIALDSRDDAFSGGFRVSIRKNLALARGLCLPNSTEGVVLRDAYDEVANIGWQINLVLALVVERVPGRLAAILGDWEASERHFASALAVSVSAGADCERVFILADYSDMLIDRDAPGDREKAVELQDEAISIATELGMKPLLERVLAKREILKA
jgi:tetratricopeptide (TPR) repeat protein